MTSGEGAARAYVEHLANGRVSVSNMHLHGKLERGRKNKSVESLSFVRKFLRKLCSGTRFRADARTAPAKRKDSGRRAAFVAPPYAEPQL